MTEQEIDIYYKTVLDLVSLAGKVSTPTFLSIRRIFCVFFFLSFIIMSQYDCCLSKRWSTDFCHAQN
jgi:hypothetical protein